MADLERQYFYEGSSGRSPTLWGVVRKAASPRFLPIVLFRLSHQCHLMGWRVVARLLSMVNFLLFGLEIAVKSQIGPGFFMPHTQGTVLGAQRIGRNAVIYHNVTCGAREIDIGFRDHARPILGDDVLVGAGAKVLGGISIGDGARVGANAVVVESVEEGNTVVGVPARVIGRRARAPRELT